MRQLTELELSEIQDRLKHAYEKIQFAEMVSQIEGSSGYALQAVEAIAASFGDTIRLLNEVQHLRSLLSEPSTEQIISSSHPQLRCASCTCEIIT